MSNRFRLEPTPHRESKWSKTLDCLGSFSANDVEYSGVIINHIPKINEFAWVSTKSWGSTPHLSRSISKYQGFIPKRLASTAGMS